MRKVAKGPRLGADFSADDVRLLARRVDAAAAKALESELEPVYASLTDIDAMARQRALASAVLLSVCYPALASTVRRHPADVVSCIGPDLRSVRSRAAYLDLARRATAGADDAGVHRELRSFARREKARIALREVLPRGLGGADVDVTSKELALLADATIEVALEEATGWAKRRYGDARSADGQNSSFVVLGMGKLGGEELNAGSDIDLIYFYDSDDGFVVPRPRGGDDPGREAAPLSMTLHEYWQRVARRLTATLEEVTEDGHVWRVDLRLRPEGGAGPLVNSLAAAERYYESFGRLWERAAMLRARPVAGDLELGRQLLSSLSAFVWRKRIDPSIAVELVHLVRRARSELSSDPVRDLKLGTGGIREAEFFVQALQLVWGGKDASLRERPTLVALARLEAKGLCTQREAADIADGYLALRRAEHAVQFGSGLQTHDLPRGGDLERVAAILGFATGAALETFLGDHRSRIQKRIESLLPEGEDRPDEWAEILGPLERGDATALAEALAKSALLGYPPAEPAAAASEVAPGDRIVALAANLVALGAHPDAILGVRAREAFPGLSETLLDALLEAADPFQAARYLRVFFDRVKQPAVYVRLVFADPAALRRLIGVLGASAFIGDALANNPELGDMILFWRNPPTEAGARREIEACLEHTPGADEDPDEALVGALRLAKTRLTIDVALADLSDACSMRDVNRLLSSVADASLEVATSRAMQGRKGLSVVAMGKLGGREISYGSDLDVLFVFDPLFAPDPIEAVGYFTRIARKIIRYISTFHGAGPGYELDTRLRPSGNQGLLVTSLDAFSLHHSKHAAAWERMALVRARHAAGDVELGGRFLVLARGAAFDAPLDAPAAAIEMARIRARVEREASYERGGVFDIKLGRGALLDIEFIVQFLQVANGPRLPEAAKTAETLAAIDALGAAGILEAGRARTLAEAYSFLRRLELRVRVVRADASHVLDPRSDALVSLARRMKMRDHPARTAPEALLAQYREVTAAVRAIFEETFGPAVGS